MIEKVSIGAILSFNLVLVPAYFKEIEAKVIICRANKAACPKTATKQRFQVFEYIFMTSITVLSKTAENGILERQEKYNKMFKPDIIKYIIPMKAEPVKNIPIPINPRIKIVEMKVPLIIAMGKRLTRDRKMTKPARETSKPPPIT